MKIKSVFVAIPSYTGKIQHEIVVALAQWSVLRTPSRIGDVCVSSGCCDIASVRDGLAEKFLASPCTHCLWIDDDMAPTHLHVARLLIEAERLHAPVLSALCFKRMVPPTMAGIPLGGRLPDTRIVEMERIGFGCVLVARSAFEAIASGCQTYKEEGIEHRGFFRPTADDRGEDYAFSRRVREAGIKLLVDRGNIVPHVGAVKYPITPKGEAFFDPHVTVISRGDSQEAAA